MGCVNYYDFDENEPMEEEKDVKVGEITIPVYDDGNTIYLAMHLGFAEQGGNRLDIDASGTILSFSRSGKGERRNYKINLIDIVKAMGDAGLLPEFEENDD